MPAAEEIQIPKDTPAPEGDQTPEQKTPERWHCSAPDHAVYWHD